MPGILPMKVIKVGSTAQTRIAQACDRCRSKKIKCDGIRPSCTPCQNVGFECKTSDKLSRRAFPRGYTESLEERVRGLESEIREMKNLVDSKEEQIEMLSKIRPSTTTYRNKKAESIVSANTGRSGSLDSSRSEEEETFKITQSPRLMENGNTPVFMGTSSAWPLVAVLKQTMEDQNNAVMPINIDSFFTRRESQGGNQLPANHPSIPGRMLSDKLVNIFFQEFSPLFPILHRPTFLTLYDRYTSSSASLSDPKSLAQLHLVFSIASLSSQSGSSSDDRNSFQSQWLNALASFSEEDSLITVQCLALATLYHMIKADYSAMLRFKGQAVSLAQRLGLHQSQACLKFGALTIETRKKVLWSLYTLDCFSAAHIGLPTLFFNKDVHCELPVDADDEYVSENGFLPTLPGESTKLSSALALFRLTRIMSNILTELYSSAPAKELTFRKIAEMQDELDTWSSELAPHLKLRFEKDKPALGTISDRTPLLSLACHYVHTLVSRPAVLASASLQSRSNASILSLASSSKRIIQIIQLLEERDMAFAFCINKNELLLQSAFGLLFQSLEIGNDSAVSRDDSKLFTMILERLENGNSPGASEFRKILESFLKGRFPKPQRHNSDASTKSSDVKIKQSLKRSSKSNSRRLSGPNKVDKNNKTTSSSDSRRDASFNFPSSQSMMFDNAGSNTTVSYSQGSMFARSEPSLSPVHYPMELTSSTGRNSMTGIQTTHPIRQAIHPPNKSSLPGSVNTQTSAADWDQLLSNLDRKIYDGIYAGLPIPGLQDYASTSSNSPDFLRSGHGEEVTPCSPTNSLWNLAQGPDLNCAPAQVHKPPPTLSFSSDDGGEGFMPTFVMDSSIGVASFESASNVDIFEGLSFNSTVQ